ncbi:hypothetical protein JQ617_09800 [Bradyrhizobium sp. KB893862 SZCCT0404]|uniref:hypothetical protein n=1 Tax=Bradyrhizobium sp. KB893862 SZCCT0404 TaxID=2807672 RepID=UPI001BA9B93A|nr:hypothetical protein [Bradyrhizobium sp. KB893862 SZCCT0404]MBR1174247.1 hypothetical protein [Bradyrhizobium sp. KB893862 SZCCT0404]
MKPGPLSADLIAALAMLAGLDHLLIGEQPVMASKANADDSGKPAAQSGRAPSMPMARDPSAAVAEEFEAARRAGTREAFELFIARHGDDPLAEQARAELKSLPR